MPGVEYWDEVRDFGLISTESGVAHRGTELKDLVPQPRCFKNHGVQ